MSHKIRRTKFNVIILGDGQVGKSSMIRCLLGREFEDVGLSTTGIDFFNDKATFDGKVYTFKIFDTAGQERYKSISRQQIKLGDGFMVVYSVDLQDTFHQIRQWIDTIEEEVDITSKPVLLVANKVDLERKISHNDGYEFASTRNIKYIETSAKTGFNIKEAFNKLYTEIYNLKKDDIKTTEESIKLKMLSKNKNKKKYC